MHLRPPAEIVKSVSQISARRSRDWLRPASYSVIRVYHIRLSVQYRKRECPLDDSERGNHSVRTKSHSGDSVVALPFERNFQEIHRLPDLRTALRRYELETLAVVPSRSGASTREGGGPKHDRIVRRCSAHWLNARSILDAPSARYYVAEKSLLPP